MKKLIIVCLCFSVLIPLVAQESKLKMIKGTWEVDQDSKLNSVDNKELIFSIAKTLTFKDNMCIISSLRFREDIKSIVKVEEGEDCLYMNMKDGQYWMVTIIDKNTIKLEMLFATVIYKRKKTT